MRILSVMEVKFSSAQHFYCLTTTLNTRTHVFPNGLGRVGRAFQLLADQLGRTCVRVLSCIIMVARCCEAVKNVAQRNNFLLVHSKFLDPFFSRRSGLMQSG